MFEVHVSSASLSVFIVLVSSDYRPTEGKKISVTEGKEEIDRTSCPYPCPNLSPSYIP